MKKTLITFITLFCAIAQGSWGQKQVRSEEELAQAVKENGANIVMMNDIELSKAITIQGDNGGSIKVTINMNGKTLKYKTALGQNTSCVFIIPSGADVDLSGGTIASVDNRSGNNTEYIAGGIVNNGKATLSNVTFSDCKGLLGGAIKNNQYATLNLNGCTFDGNVASTKDGFVSGNGGAIWNDGNLILSNVTIRNCKAENGAGIFNDANGSVTMSGDNNETIFTQNTANVNGGAIFSNGTMTLQHVNINKNTSTTGNGGAIYVSAKGIVNINTSSFLTENKANQGGGIYNGGIITMQGSITANKNTVGDDVANNIYLVKGKVITVTGNIKGSQIGISVPEMPTVITSGYSTDNSDTAPNTIFTSDNEPDLYSASISENEVSIGVPSPFYITEEGILRKAIDKLDDVKFQLSNDINITNSTLEIPSGKTVTIDLGGFKMDRGLKAREWNTGGQVITVRKDATLNLSNGTLTGGWGGASGGINNEGGTVNLTNVNITGCTGDDRGGGICNRDGGTLTMKGGSLTNNTSNDATHPRGGGGLFNAEGATATLTGVTITGNKNKTYGGGGICNFGTLTIDGCTITGNTAGANGGAIWQEGTLNLQGKNTITDNQAGGKANNVYLYKTVINVTGSLAGGNVSIQMEDILGTFTSGYKKNNADVDPATVFKADNAVVFVPVLSGDEAALALQQLVKAASDADLRTAASFDGANIQLANDIKMSNSTLVIGGDKTVTIDLNGKTLDRGLTSRDFDHGGQVITVRNGGTLNLTGGTLTGGYGGNGGGLVNEGGTATLTNVTITGCKADQRGGAISNYGTLTMTGGSITGNTSNDIMASDTDLVGGGGIYTSGGSTTTLTGVTITGNQAKGAGGGGVNNWGTVTLDGCTITGNTSKANGGGVWNGLGSTINMQGKNTVTDNQDNSKTNNVYLRDGVIITVTGSLEGSKIGVGMSQPGVFTSGYKENNDVEPIKYFDSDRSDYDVVLIDNEAELKKKMGTGIENVNGNGNGNNNAVYNLNGQRLSKPQNGINIINGKKVVIK
jgi:predicted outer membrane repeat protein